MLRMIELSKWGATKNDVTNDLLLISFKKIQLDYLSIEINMIHLSFLKIIDNYLISLKNIPIIHESFSPISFFSFILFQEHNWYIIPILTTPLDRRFSFSRDRRVGVQRTDKERRRNGEGEKEEKLTSAEKITSLSIACQTNGTSRVSSLDRFARKSRFDFDSFGLQRTFRN